MSALIQHSTLPDAQKHEPKGTDTATAGQVYVADGAGSGSFQAPPPPGAGALAHDQLAGLADDDHTQYLTETRHDALASDNPHGVTADQVGADPAGTANSAILAHAQAADPHGQYLTPMEHQNIGGNPHGVTAIDAGADPVGTAAAAITSHENATNPHPQYLTEDLLIEYLDRHHVANDTEAVNQTTALQQYISGSFELAHDASYRVMANYVWSMNSISTDLLVELRIDGNVVGIPQRHEPQDVAGVGSFGTDQRYPASIMELVTLTAGVHTFEIFWAGSTTNDGAALYRADIFVERYI